MAGDKQATARKAHGYFRAEGWYGEVEEADTHQCCHCGAHFPVRKGSGRKRGWCCACNQVTCGRPQCDPCQHFMRKIEALEAGRRLDQMPIKARVPAEVPRAHVAGGILLGGGNDDGNRAA